MDEVIFTSEAMRRCKALADRIADTDVPVLLLGESGTGKEVFARGIHRRSRRCEKPFLKVNCAALPGELLESELFGHERGAFTGASSEKPGQFELADQGTIFLDEIGELDIRLQAKLLQVLQDEEFFRVGGKKSVRVDARVVVATNRDLEREIAAGRFRDDLYYRLNVVSLRLPALRERKEDIQPLVAHFFRKYAPADGGRGDLPANVLVAFQEHDWPGNVRELENRVRRMVVLNDPALALEDLGRAPAPATPKAEVLELSLKDIGKRAAMAAEREAIVAMLQRVGWNKRRAAAKLQVSYKALLYKIRDAGIVDPRSVADG